MGSRNIINYIYTNIIIHYNSIYDLTKEVACGIIKKEEWKVSEATDEQQFGRMRWQALREKYPMKRHERPVKIDVLEHYGGGKLACVRCGFSDIRALTLDHVNGNGADDRKLRGSGGRLYFYLRRFGYPEGYQTLCMNCQFIKAHENKEYRGFQNK